MVAVARPIHRHPRVAPRAAPQPNHIVQTATQLAAAVSSCGRAALRWARKHPEDAVTLGGMALLISGKIRGSAYMQGTGVIIMLSASVWRCYKGP